MSTEVTPSVTTFTRRVGLEIKVAMLRKGVSGRWLAGQLGESQTWISTRLTGTTPIDVNDLERIAAALGVDVASLLPQSARGSIAQTVRRPKTSRYGAVRTILTAPRPAARNDPATSKMTVLSLNSDGRARRLPA